MSIYFSNIRSSQLRDTSLHGKQCQEKILHISLNAIATRLANTRTDGTIRVWKVSTLGPSDCTLIKSGHAKPVSRISWLPSSETRFASVGGDAYVKLWSLSGALEREIKVTTERGNEQFQLVDFSVDGLYLSATDGETLVILDVNNSYAKLHELKLSSPITEVRWLFDPSTLLVGLEDGKIEILQVKDTLEKVATIEGARLAVNSIAVDPRGKLLCAGCEEGIVYFWRTSDLQIARALTKVDEAITSVDINRDGNYVAVCYAKDSNLKFFDTETLQQVHEVSDTAVKVAGSTQVRWLQSLAGYIYTSDQNKVMNYAKKSL